MDISILKQISEIKDISALEKRGLVYLDEKRVANKICEKLIDIETQLKILNLCIEHGRGN